MGLIRGSLRLYLVTDPRLCAEAGLVETVRAAVAGGVTCVQLRDKQAGTEALAAQARAVKAALAGSGVPVIVNDDVEAAMLADADGVHVGQGDMPPAEVRALIGAGKILGLSCETLAHAEAAPGCVDYLGLGPVFATATKTDHAAPLGFDGLARLCDAAQVPCVAIGGLDAAHVGAVRQAGADGLAVVSAICGQGDACAAAEAFFRESER